MPSRVALLLLLVAVLHETGASKAQAQFGLPVDSTAVSPQGLVVDAGFALGLTHGAFSGEVGTGKGGLRLALGVQGTHFGVGISFGGVTIGSYEEAARLESGTELDVETDTDLAFLTLYGRAGTPLGRYLHPFVEGLAGVNNAGTETRLQRKGNQQTLGGQSQRDSYAPVVGVGAGIFIGDPRFPVALQVSGRYLAGGEMSYLVYDGASGAFAERTTSTHVTYVTLSVVLNPWTVTS